ncbi:hypothetical protein JCM8208_003728 [Rhodotorula glutinis]
MLRLKVEDRPTPKEVYNWRVYLASAVAAFAAVFIGYDGAFIGTALSFASFKEEFGLVGLPAKKLADISANVVSSYQAGAIAGVVVGYPVGIFLGRRWGLVGAACVFSIGAGIMLAANSSTGLGPIYAGRVLAGAGIGAASNLAPLYISEVAPPAVRGQMLALYEIGWQVGAVVGFWINKGAQDNIARGHTQWLLSFAVQLVPSGIFLAGLFFLVESPRWLIRRGRREEGLKKLCYLRQLPLDHVYMREEIEMIDAAIEEDERILGTGFWAPFKVFRNRALLYRLVLTCALFAWQNGTGINAINYYSPTILRNMGITGQNTSLLTTGVFGSIKCGLSIVWAFFLVETMGRRKMLMIGAVGSSLSMLVIAGITKTVDPVANPTTSIPPSGIASLAFLYVWTIFYAVSWNGTPWVVVAESFSGSIQPVAQVFGAGSNWLWNFVISRATPTMFLNMGASGFGVFLFFGLCTAAAVPYVYFLLPETKSVPREEVDRLFRKGLTPRHANKIVLAELAAERESHTGAYAGGQGLGSSGLGSEKDKGEEEFFEGARSTA